MVHSLLVGFMAFNAIETEANDGFVRFAGTIKDLRLPGGNSTPVTNTLSVRGDWVGDIFHFKALPHSAEDEIEEDISWNGSALYILARWPTERGSQMPRTNALAYIEPEAFSRYATHASASLLMALAPLELFKTLDSSNRIPVILGTKRVYPEEDNRYELNVAPSGRVSVKAFAPGFQIVNGSTLPLATAYKNGFLRWQFERERILTNGTDVLIFDYHRYFPKVPAANPQSAEDVVEFRRVRGTIELSLRSDGIKPGLPSITEPLLNVWDFSQRGQFTRDDDGGRGEVFMNKQITNRTWSIDMAESKRGVATVAGGMAYRDKNLSRNFPRVLFFGLVFLGILAPFLMLRWRAPNSGIKK